MGRIVTPDFNGRPPRDGGALMLANQLNQMFGEINGQVGRLAANGQVVVGYVVAAFQPALERPGGLSVRVHWYTAAPRCLHAIEGRPCAAPATWARQMADGPPVYLCDDHAAPVDPSERALISDIVASMAPAPAADEGGSPS